VEDSDEELWVRYGALRSLLEVAAGSARPIRRRVFTALGNADLARTIASSQPLRKETIRALAVADMPDDWHALAGDFWESAQRKLTIHWIVTKCYCLLKDYEVTTVCVRPTHLRDGDI
jgi:hypothetical protein